MPIYFGHDSSGNSNNWRAFNLDDSGVATDPNNDSLTDTPSNWGGDAVDNGAEVRGDYAILIPAPQYNAAVVTIADNGLRTIGPNSSGNACGDIALPWSGKWYMEYVIGPMGQWFSNYIWVGVQDITGFTGNGSGYNNSGEVVFNGALTTGLATFLPGDIIGCAYDMDNNTASYYKNGVQVGTTGTLGTRSKTYVPWVQTNFLNDGVIANFGQKPFVYAPPTGYKSLNTKNLNEQYPFATGPDLVWIKGRSALSNHVLHDTVRGTRKYVLSNLTNSEGSDGSVVSFNSNGFSLGTDGGASQNANTTTYVSWNWNAGSITRLNNDGTVPALVRANPAAGFSIVQWDTPASGSYTVGHGLGTAPKFIILKGLNDTNHWLAGHSSIGWNNFLHLSLSNSIANAARWNDTPPTNTFFSLGGSFYTTGAGAGARHVAYVWSEIPGYSRFGSYTGNASADGPFVYCGFRPRWILIKRTDASAPWMIYDVARDTINPMFRELQVNSNEVENSGTTNISGRIDILSNGFKERSSSSDSNFAFENASGGNYIFAAFAEMPLRYTLAR